MNALASSPNRYLKGEFDKHELPAPSKASSSPIFAAYTALKNTIIPAGLQNLVTDFISAVESTFVARKRRSLKFVRTRVRPVVLA